MTGRLIDRIEHFRRIAIGYDKTAQAFRSMTRSARGMVRLRCLSTGPEFPDLAPPAIEFRPWSAA